MKRSSNIGKCNTCGDAFAKSGMLRHIKSCLAKNAGAQPKSGQTFKVFHIVAEGAYAPEYWMHLDVPVAAALTRLDRFLRDIWLECCGHLSAFTIEGVRYSSYTNTDSMWGSPEEGDMSTKLYKVLAPGMTFQHEYDFGTSTNLKLTVVEERMRTVNSAGIVILARNNPPAIPCEKCGKSAATQVCSCCIFDGKAWYCDTCAPDHECGEEMMLPVTNSPRVGMCGYTG